MKVKDWKIPYTRPCIPHAFLAAGFTPLLSAVLSLRGINTVSEANELISGGKDCIHDPMLVLGMDRAVDRLHRAIDQKETVAVYGDYDVDGITSTCLLTDYLRSKGLNCIPYIPDRVEEGYGLNCGALDLLAQQGASLLVTVDCGITAVEEAQYAKSLGIDMVITDHHECGADTLPEAAALIDCKQDGDNYPNKYLAGVGVALKLVCACEGSSTKMLDKYADLAAIGTIADVMPLVGENRYLVQLGLKQIAQSPRPGIAAMLKESSIDARKLSAATIGFSLAPRLNAAGRLGQASTAAKLLMSQDMAAAEALAIELCEMNRQRQNIEMEIWQQANGIISGTSPDSPIVLASDDWHQGVIGIAASRLSEQYSLPAIMICMNGEIGKGSCRSYGGFNLYEALSACSEHLIGFGGHALAAGLNIRRDQLDAFRQALAEYYNLNRPSPLPEVQCDLLINNASMLSIENVRSLEALEPYGNRNPKPTMCFSGVRLEYASPVGGGRHLRMRVLLGHSRFESIFFSHTLDDLGIHEGDLIDLAFSPQINEFRGNVSVQLVVVAARRHSCTELCDAILHADEDVLWAAAPYCPDRADFVRIWRSLGKSFCTGKNTEEIIRQCIDAMEPEKFCICLMVLLETGLLESADGGIFVSRRAEINGKADLGATELIKALKKNRQG